MKNATSPETKLATTGRLKQAFLKKIRLLNKRHRK